MADKDLATSILKVIDRAEASIKELQPAPNFEECRAKILDTMRRQIKNIIDGETTQYFEYVDDAFEARYAPAVPCRVMSTRACVDLSLNDDLHYRKDTCKTNECTRFETRAKKV